MRHVTIKDIARALNVSVSTVSRAFNDAFDIKHETRELILNKAKEMGYTPNPIAKKLLNKKSYNIGVVVPEFKQGFFPEAITGMQEVLFRHGYQVLIMQSGEDSEIELSNVKTLVDNKVDGIIISLSKETLNSDYYKDLIASGLPIVFFNRVNNDLKASNVTFDNYKWSFFATEHLLEQGCRNPVYLSAPFALSFAIERKRGFLDALIKHKITDGPERIFEAGISTEKGELAMNNAFNKFENIDGVFAVNDLSAIGALSMIREKGLKVPNDIALVGFTKTLLGDYIDPQLSTVEQPVYDMGVKSAELLLNQINSESKDFIPEKVILSGKLLRRSSSCR